MPRPDRSLHRPGTLSRRACLSLGGLAALTLLGGCATPAEARARWLDLRVIDRDTGRALPHHAHRGDTWLPAEAGMRYALQVTNLSAERLLVVLSVDGINIVTGESAAYGQSGYVLSPGERYRLTGWRKSNAEVAAFEFSQLGRSYAARTGRPFDVGVIGAAVFRERPPVIESPPLGRADENERRADTRAASRQEAAGEAGATTGDTTGATTGADASAAAAVPPVPLAKARAATPPVPGAAMGATQADRATAESAMEGSAPAQAARRAPALRERLGTAHGRREASYVSTTPFERASATPQEVLALRYDSTHNLIAMGVIRRTPARPSPFPLARHEPGYVPDPPGGTW